MPNNKKSYKNTVLFGTLLSGKCVDKRDERSESGVYGGGRSTVQVHFHSEFALVSIGFYRLRLLR